MNKTITNLEPKNQAHKMAMGVLLAMLLIHFIKQLTRCMLAESVKLKF